MDWVFLDANVLLSAALRPKAGLLRLWTLANATLITSDHAIELSPEVMVCADWIIDLGLGPGDEGGRIVAAGTPEHVARSGTLTGGVIIAAALEKGGPVDPA